MENSSNNHDNVLTANSDITPETSSPTTAPEISAPEGGEAAAAASPETPQLEASTETTDAGNGAAEVGDAPAESGNGDVTVKEATAEAEANEDGDFESQEADDLEDDESSEGGMVRDEQLDRMYEESFRSLTEGEVLTGVVVQIGKEYIMVDVGSKSEGRINIREFINEEGVVEVRKGDEVEALLVKRGDDDGDMILSKERASRQKLWDELAKIHADGGVVEGLVTGKVKGGLEVDISGIKAFLPGSQLDVKTVKNADSFIGKTFSFLIIKMNRRRSNVVLSRRAIQQREIDEKRSATLATLSEGAIVEGVVKNLTAYGAFLDLGGLDGLLHITDVSWGRANRLEDHVKVGELLKVKVLSFDKNKGKVSLGLKQLQDDPWTSATKKFHVGERVQGRVVSLTEYGAFVEIAPGVEGLIHVSEMSWTRKVRNPSAILKVDDIVDCVIQNINSEGKRISLSMKQIEPNPWATVADRYPIGTIIEGKIKSITDFGVFIGIDEGIDGLVHISDMSWNRRNRHPSELYKKGDSVRALILSIDTELERFSLGIKQLEDDPWAMASLNYPVGKTVTGKVNNITEFGVFVELADGIDGLIHYTQTGAPKGKPLTDYFKLGDEVTAKIINIAIQEHKIGLSLKSKGKDEEDASFKEYSDSARSHGQGKEQAGAFGSAFENLGKLLAESNQAAEEENKE
ncbi:MAG: 30S ribosomal protein S1 [Deltaproteobacteria bacterium]|jgi:small subunit ribosomal protein S1|nr:30S ribosomal protein S1 [Deltaproteobacteria bacterium]